MPGVGKVIVGFKKQFEDFVREGTKRHTLRDERNGERQIVQGDRLDCYGDVRQKTQHLLGRWPCTRVQVATFEQIPGPTRLVHCRMYIDGVALSEDEADSFAWRDGFRKLPSEKELAAHPKRRYSIKTEGCFSTMMRYWIREGKQFPFTKKLIHWDFDKPVAF